MKENSNEVTRRKDRKHRSVTSRVLPELKFRNLSLAVKRNDGGQHYSHGSLFKARCTTKYLPVPEPCLSNWLAFHGRSLSVQVLSGAIDSIYLLVSEQITNPE
jgi:hypothetical protein